MTGAKPGSSRRSQAVARQVLEIEAAAILGLVQHGFQTAPAVERTLRVLDQPAEREDDCAFAVYPDAAPVTFENVSFGYDGEQNVLKGTTFSLEKGTTTALVGASGSGKSTVL